MYGVRIEHNSYQSAKGAGRHQNHEKISAAHKSVSACFEVPRCKLLSLKCMVCGWNCSLHILTVQTPGLMRSNQGLMSICGHGFVFFPMNFSGKWSVYFFNIQFLRKRIVKLPLRDVGRVNNQLQLVPRLRDHVQTIEMRRHICWGVLIWPPSFLQHYARHELEFETNLLHA